MRLLLADSQRRPASGAVVGGNAPVITPVSNRWTPVKSTSGLLHWPRPPMVTPHVVNLTPTTGRFDAVDDYTDYRIVLPSEPMQVETNIGGGRFVEIIGGESASTGRILYLHGQTGGAFVEGLKTTNVNSTEGINLDQRLGATVVIQNCSFAGLSGASETNHADIIQTWAGPDRLLIDRLSGVTSYQGFFLLPGQQWAGAPAPTQWDFDHVMIDVTTGGYALTTVDEAPWLTVGDVRVIPNPSKDDKNQWAWPRPDSGHHVWDNALRGAPSTPFVDLNSIGIGYTSLAT
jgi:hypothetical protein